MKVTKNHCFKSGSKDIPEVNSICIEHNENLIFVCTSCNVSVCMKCITGKHNGHKVANIADTITDLKLEFNKDIKTKIDAATKIVADTANCFKTFDNNIYFAIKAILDEGTQVKRMIDHHVGQVIATLKEKANLEKDKLSNIISDAKQVLERCNELKIRNDQLQTAREDINLIQKLKALKIESDKVQVGDVPELPIVNISNATVTDEAISQLCGIYSIRQCNEQKQKEQKLYLYTCDECGTKITNQKKPDDDEFDELNCETCQDRRYVTFVMEV